MFGPELIRMNSLINELIETAKRGSKNRAELDFSFLQRQPRNFENTTLVARPREHFRCFLTIFLVAQLSPKRGVLVHKNSLASCQRCRHSARL